MDDASGSGRSSAFSAETKLAAVICFPLQLTEDAYCEPFSVATKNSRSREELFGLTIQQVLLHNDGPVLLRLDRTAARPLHFLTGTRSSGGWLHGALYHERNQEEHQGRRGRRQNDQRGQVLIEGMLIEH
jgi:hypothetical protein